MLKTTHRPPAIPCGGLNALYPLHRNCQITPDCSCEDSESTPVGVWFDGMTLYWEQGKALTAFGLPVLKNSEVEDFEANNPGAFIETDSDILPMRSDLEMGQPPWLVSIHNGDEDSEGPVAGWEHYFGCSMVVSSIAAGIEQAYALDGQPTRMGLAVNTMTLDDEYEGNIIALVYLPRWMPDHEITYQVREKETQSLVSSHVGVLTLKAEDFAYFVPAGIARADEDSPISSNHYVELVTSSSPYMQGWRSLVSYNYPDSI